MFRIGCHCLLSPIQKYSTNSMSKGLFSYFLTTRNEERVLPQSTLCCVRVKRSGVGHVNFLTVFERSATSKAEERLVNLNKNESTLSEKEEEERETRGDVKSGISNFETIKHSVNTSLVKEDNLELLWEVAKGDLQSFNALRQFQMKLSILNKILGISMDMGMEQWTIIMKNNSIQNERYLTYLLSNILRKQNEYKKKIKLEKLFGQDVEEEDYAESNLFDDPMCYHLFHNALFIGFRQLSFKKLQYSRAMVSVLHGPEVFIDCSYDDYMNDVESKYLSKQIIDAIKINLMSLQPVHLILCNFNKDSVTGKSMTKYSPMFYDKAYPVTITSKSFLDFHSRQKFIYLTPHCTKMMKEFDPNKCYIIGGFVDKTKPQNVSLAKAKENNIEMAKFPIDQYVSWQQGKKTLCVNHVLDILLRLKNNNNDWNKAFEVLPRRYFLKQVPGKKKKRSAVTDIVHYVCSIGNISAKKLIHNAKNNH